MTGRTLVVRLDGMGDVLISGPAIRAISAGSRSVGVLASAAGAAAAELLPGVSDVLLWQAPWILADPPPVTSSACIALVQELRRGGFDRAVILTSFHQSCLPTALLLRLAGIGWIAGVSTDYPGSLLDRRIAEPADLPEPLRMLEIAEASGYRLPDGDDGTLAITPQPPIRPWGAGEFVVVHPGAAAPSRTRSPEAWLPVVQLLIEAGYRVALTGSGREASLLQMIQRDVTVDDDRLQAFAGLSFSELAGLLGQARVVVSGNTGPAHLAAATGTAVVSLFSPVVPAIRWAPHTDRRVVLGDQQAPCAGSRATVCPVPGHPCIDGVRPEAVLTAVDRMFEHRAGHAADAHGVGGAA